MINEQIDEKIRTLNCWKGDIQIEPLSGGITNQNFKITDQEKSAVARIGTDIYEHLILRSTEAAASLAAYEIGVSPELIHHEPGVLVIKFIDGQVLSCADVNKPENLLRILNLLKRFHRDMPQQYKGYPIMFWVFQVILHYEHVLRVGRSEHFHRLPDFLEIAHRLQTDVGKIELVFGHNDLLAANFIDDGVKLWLIDFDYAGFNSPLFDLANLASNNLFNENLERQILEDYFEMQTSPKVWQSFQAMKCASLLRETMWSMVSEIHSELDFDYSKYSQENLSRFELAYASYQAEFD